MANKKEFGPAGIFSTDNWQSDQMQIEAEQDATCPECGEQPDKCHCDLEHYGDSSEDDGGDYHEELERNYFMFEIETNSDLKKLLDIKNRMHIGNEKTQDIIQRILVNAAIEMEDEFRGNSNQIEQDIEYVRSSIEEKKDSYGLNNEELKAAYQILTGVEFETNKEKGE